MLVFLSARCCIRIPYAQNQENTQIPRGPNYFRRVHNVLAGALCVHQRWCSKLLFGRRLLRCLCLGLRHLCRCLLRRWLCGSQCRSWPEWHQKLPMDPRESNFFMLQSPTFHVPDPFEQGAGLKILYLWVPRMFTHIRDNAKLEFKSKTRSHLSNLWENGTSLLTAFFTSA